MATSNNGTKVSLQARVGQWVIRCLGSAHLMDRRIRAKRLLEEALELAQSESVTKDVALAWVEWVYGRPVGRPRQEAAGVGLCLLAYCEAMDEDYKKLIETELARVSSAEMMAKIREKQAIKELVGAR